MVYRVDNLFIRGECGEVQAVSEAFDSLNAFENVFAQCFRECLRGGGLDR